MDSGNFLFKKKTFERNQESNLKTARAVAEIYRRLDYQAVNIGPYDLSFGLPFLLELDDLPWVSANFFTGKENKPLFNTHRIAEINDITLAITGVSPAPDLPKAEFSYKPWQQTLPDLIAQLETQADCLILLSSLPETENVKITHAFPSIRLLVTALPDKGNIPHRLLNKTILTQVEDRGKYLGRLVVSNPGYDTWKKRTTTPVKRFENRIKAVQYRLAKNTALLAKYSVDSPEARKIQADSRIYEKRLDDLQKQLSQLIEGKANSAEYQITHIPISSGIREDREIEMIIESTKENLHPKS